MKTRLTLVVAVALLAAACGGGASTAEGTVLRYSYAPGRSLAYDIEVGASMTTESSGDAHYAAALDGTMAMSVTGRLDLSFAEGPDPGTVEVTISESLFDGGARVTFGGREQFISFDELAAGVPADVVIVLDDQGRLQSAAIGGVALPAQLLASLSSLEAGAGLQPQHFGPEFPEEGLVVGDEWDTSVETDALGMHIAQHGHHRVAAEEEVLGRTTFRIESEITTSAITADLADLVGALSANPELLGAEAEGLEAALAEFEAGGLGFSLTMDESTTSMVTWFDPVAGIVVRAEVDTPTTLDMQMTGLPEVGNLSYSVTMDGNQTITLAG